MATRQTLRHQVFNPDGSLKSETTEDEPLPDFHERETRERLEGGIATATAGVGAADTDLADIDAIVWANNTTAAQVRTQVMACVARQRRIAGRQRILIVMLRSVLRLLLRRFDARDPE